MQIAINDIYVVGYATIGRIADGIEVEQSELPNNFFAEFMPERFLYSDGKVTENPNYIPPPEPEPEPTVEEQLAEANAKIDELTECILEMSEIIYA